MASLEFEKEKKAFKLYYDSMYALFAQASNSFSTLIALLLADHDKFDTPRIISRVKDREECLKKFERKYLSDLEKDETPYEIKDYITDIVGLRVVTLYDTDIELIEAVLEANFVIIDRTNKSETLEKKDDSFGYKGLHLDLKLNDLRTKLPEYSAIQNIQFEVQVRTIVQDAWSVLDHKIKYKKNIPHKLKRRINRLAALFELSDQEFVNIRNETTELEHKAKELNRDEILGIGDSTIDKNILDTLSFLNVVHDFFPDYEFYGFKVDGFVDELINLNSDLTATILQESLTENDELLKKYREYQYTQLFNTLNPYTIIRHALYLKDKAKHHLILFHLQRQTFDNWLDENQSK